MFKISLGKNKSLKPKASNSTGWFNPYLIQAQGARIPPNVYRRWHKWGILIDINCQQTFWFRAKEELPSITKTPC